MLNVGARNFLGGETWTPLGVGLALAFLFAQAPALAQVTDLPHPSRMAPGDRYNPMFGLVPFLGGGLLTAPSANPQPLQGEDGPAPSSSPRPHRTSLRPPPPAPPPPTISAHAFLPPPGETRFRRGEILVEISLATPPAFLALIARRHRLVEARAVPIALLGTSVHLWRIPDARDVASVVRELGYEPSLASVQPDYLYAAQQHATPAPSAAAEPTPAPSVVAEPTPAPSVAAEPTAAPTPAAAAEPTPSPPQYSLAKLHVDAFVDPAPAEPVRVAVIDTAVDDAHPDLKGAVEERFDAIGAAAPARTLDHGTAVAGAIAARGRLKGVDPYVRILAARAFDSEGAGPIGETLWLLQAIDWAARERARVVNLSFAGPPDPALHAILAAAAAKGMTLIAAAGNAGPNSPPLYPAADPAALAVTATDADDKLYKNANVGRYIAVAAPGVDVLLPAPRASYALQTGTSVSAALVSGVVALMLERRPAASPAEIRKWLAATAAPLGGGGRPDEFGAGLVDARRAAEAAAAAK